MLCPLLTALGCPLFVRRADPDSLEVGVRRHGLASRIEERVYRLDGFLVAWRVRVWGSVGIIIAVPNPCVLVYVIVSMMPCLLVWMFLA